MKHCNYCQKQIVKDNRAFYEDVCEDDDCMEQAYNKELENELYSEIVADIQYE
jgi:hypothetical protein